MWHLLLLIPYTISDHTSITPGTIPPTPTPNCTDFSLRLANQVASASSDGQVSIEGHVEICINGTYFAICDLGWDDRDAQATCNAVTNTTGAYSTYDSVLLIV